MINPIAFQIGPFAIRWYAICISSSPLSFSFIFIIAQKWCNFKSYDWTLRKLQSHPRSLPAH